MSKKKFVTYGMVVIGILFLNSMSFCVFAFTIDLEHVKVEINYRINCPILYKRVSISIGESMFSGDLILFDRSDCNIILGMNSLHTVETKIDCKDLNVILNDKKGREICFCRPREKKSCSLISAMKVSCYVKGVLDTGVTL